MRDEGERGEGRMGRNIHSAHECDIARVKGAGVGGLHGSRNRQRLSGHGTFVNLEHVHGNEAQVGGDLVALSKHNDISLQKEKNEKKERKKLVPSTKRRRRGDILYLDEGLAGHGHLVAVADHKGLLREHLVD